MCLFRVFYSGQCVEGRMGAVCAVIECGMYVLERSILGMKGEISAGEEWEVVTTSRTVHLLKTKRRVLHQRNTGYHWCATK